MPKHSRPDVLGALVDRFEADPMHASVRVFTIEELEIGLRMLDGADLDREAFWDANIDSFRRTVLFAIRETSNALLSPKITTAWQAELENQLEMLAKYIEFAERHIRRRARRVRRLN